MIEEKDIFNESVKGHLENIEVPYNESHWKEMEQSLDQMNPSDFGSPGSNVKYYVAAGISIALLAGYFLIDRHIDVEKTQTQTPDTQEMHTGSPHIATEESSSTKGANLESKEVIVVPETGQEPIDIRKSEENSVDHKADKYASRSEDQIKKEAKQIADDLVKAQVPAYTNTPNIDNPALKAEIVIGKGPYCVGDPISFSTEPTHENVSYSWNFGDRALTSRKQDPTHVFKRSGTFEIIVLISEGEKNDYAVKSQITIEKKPEVEINISNQKITLNMPYVEVSASSNSKCNYFWTFNEHVNAQGSEASFLVPDKGFYPISLKATSKDGCLVNIAKTYNADKGVKVFAPSAFTPNGDMKNDDFLPKELVDSYVEFNFAVSDMNGARVFDTHDKYTPWNGSLNNMGNTLPTGVYNWVLTFTDDLGKSHKQIGKIKLIK